MLLSVRILQRNKIYHHLDDKAHGGTGPLKLFEAQLTQSVCWLSSSDSSIKRNKYSNTEIRTAFENRKYCTAVFLDFFHTFHRVWLKGVLNQKVHTSTTRSLESGATPPLLHQSSVLWLTFISSTQLRSQKNIYMPYNIHFWRRYNFPWPIKASGRNYKSTSFARQKHWKVDH